MIFESNHFDWRIESTGTRKLLDRCQISAIPQRERPKLSSKYPPKDPKRSQKSMNSQRIDLFKLLHKPLGQMFQKMFLKRFKNIP